MKKIRVGMAEFKIGQCPDTMIVFGLGSCVAVALYEQNKKIGGLAHVMLPAFSKIRKNDNPIKFADLAIEIMLEEMIKKGAEKKEIGAKLIGGAHMFSFRENVHEDIGTQNVNAVRKKLEEEKIFILGSDTGGKHGRSLEFFTESGLIIIKAIKFGIVEI